MIFEDIVNGKTYRDIENGITGKVIGKYDGLHVKNVDFQPLSPDGTSRAQSYWAWPSVLEEV